MKPLARRPYYHPAPIDLTNVEISDESCANLCDGIVNVVGTEVVFMDDIVVAVRGGPPPPVAAPTPKDSQVSLGDE